jgi:hypothetical protein
VLDDLGTQGAEVFDDECDAVGLLDAELFRVTDLHAIRGIGSDGGEHGKLVDELRGERTRDIDATQRASAIDLDGTDHLAVLLGDVQHLDDAAHGADDVEQRGAGWVHAKRV